MDRATIRRTLATVLPPALLSASLYASPASAQVSVEGSTVREQRAQPGETYAGSFTVVNASDEAQQARIYQTDYLTDAAGTNSYAPAGTTSRSNGGWVSVRPSTLTVPPHSTREVAFTVTVPSGRPLSGSYWSMVMVEGVPRGSAESTLPGRPSRQVQTAVVARIRYAVQIVTQVGAPTRPIASFAAPAVHSAAGGTKELQVDVANGGIRSFAPAFTLEVYASDGTRVARTAASREILYPGTSLRQRFNLGTLGAGTYRALVTLDAGDDAVFGAQYTLKL